VHYRTLDVPERFDCHVALLSTLLSPAVRRLFAAIATSVPDLISQTDLVAVAPSRVARSFTNSHGLRPRPLPFQLPPFSVRVHWSARHESNAAHTWMRELLLTSVSRL
jgi:DNA-binding transcriptional LysR family regulator